MRTVLLFSLTVALLLGAAPATAASFTDSEGIVYPDAAFGAVMDSAPIVTPDATYGGPRTTVRIPVNDPSLRLMEERRAVPLPPRDRTLPTGAARGAGLSGSPRGATVGGCERTDSSSSSSGDPTPSSCCTA